VEEGEVEEKRGRTTVCFARSREMTDDFGLRGGCKGVGHPLVGRGSAFLNVFWTRTG